MYNILGVQSSISGFSCLPVLCMVVLLLSGLALEPAVLASGAFFWRTWGGKGNDFGNGVAVDPLDNIFVTGTTAIFGSGIFLLKYSSQGSLMWQKVWTGNAFTSGRADDDFGPHGRSV